MDYKKSQFFGIRNMANRLNYHGGFNQQDRMIAGKEWSLGFALKYSYQAAKIKRIAEKENIPALINPNKLKQDYDDKILSVGLEYGFKPGDVFEWANTGTKWLIYLQDLTELAYFRGDIRKCSYEVSWKDENEEIQTTYLAIRGPVETRINYIQKEGISVDLPNLSLNMLMPKNEATLKYFKRYAKFYLKGLAAGDVNTCWRVEATDSISMPGILEINAVEYYSNETVDDTKNGIVDGLVVEPVKPEKSLIDGEGFIKPKISYNYIYRGKENGNWEIINSNKLPIKAEIDGKKITIKWEKTFSGEFILKYGSTERTIVVESLF